MKIVVLNGSPKGDGSITLQYIRYIQKKFPRHELKIINISRRIKQIEESLEVFEGIIREVEKSDALLWISPIYFFLIPSQYKKFIELIFERGKQASFNGKYAAALTTSIQLLDHIAHNYIHAVCDDLGMKYVGSFCADFRDLFIQEKRKYLLTFADNFFKTIEGNFATVRCYMPVTHSFYNYTPGRALIEVDNTDKKIVVVADLSKKDGNLGKMITYFKSLFIKGITCLDLNEVDIKTGCSGCFGCGFENICIYQNHDQFFEAYNKNVRAADILIFAGTVKDRFLSSRLKLFIDRTFFRTKKPTMVGKQIGFIISGPLSQTPNIRQMFTGYAAMLGANLVDFVTDECNDSAEIDRLISNFSRRLINFAKDNYVAPLDFIGLGLRKFFRDDLWDGSGLIFQVDEKYYRKHRMYNFPQRGFKRKINIKVLMLLTKIPRFRKWFLEKMTGIEGYREVISKNT